jgi:hypothetical protein
MGESFPSWFLNLGTDSRFAGTWMGPGAIPYQKRKNPLSARIGGKETPGAAS